jgi:hypothetical protein
MTPATEAALLPVGAAVTASAATACLGARGLMAWPVVVAAMLLIAAAAWAVLHWPTGRGAARRRALAQPVVAGSMLLIAVLALARVRSGGSVPAELVHQIGTTLSFPLAVMLIAQLGSAVSLRELGVLLVGCLLCVVLSLGTMPGGTSPHVVSGFGLCLLVGWCAGLVTLCLLHRAKERAQAPHHLGGRGPGVGVMVGLLSGSVLLGLAAVHLLPHPTGVHVGAGTQGAPGSTGQSGAGAAGGRGPRATSCRRWTCRPVARCRRPGWLPCPSTARRCGARR